MKLLIIGAGTIAGHSLLRIFPRESAAELLFAYDSRDTISPLAGIDHRIIDLIDKKQVKTLCNEFRPDVIINTAGWHDIDKCERQKQFCWQMNTALPETLARISVINECRLICHSTDMIFPGSEAPYSEEARPSPVNYYAKSRLAMENILKSRNYGYTILRSSAIYGPNTSDSYNFFNTEIEYLRKGENFSIPGQFLFNPLYADDFARTALAAILKRKSGIFNIGSPGMLTFSEAIESVKHVFKSKSNIDSVPPDNFFADARLPSSAGLITLKAETDLGIKFTNLKNGLTAYKLYLDKLTNRSDQI